MAGSQASRRQNVRIRVGRINCEVWEEEAVDLGGESPREIPTFALF